MRTLPALALTLLLTACGSETPADADAATSNKDSAPAPAPSVDPALASLWAGHWQLRDLATNQLLVRFEIRVQEGRWTGQFTLTPDFCQTSVPGAPSHCPFEGAGGSLQDIDANAVALIALGIDPFMPGQDLSLTLTSADGATIDTVAVIADAGRMSVSGPVDPAPR